MQILIVEDERRLAYALGKIFEEQKMHVDIVNDGEAGFEYGLAGIYDCIVLDIMLPKMDGFEVLKKLRDFKIDTPIIMLTARDAISDKVKGLTIGADDYMTKPFAPEELVARVKALTRRKGEVILDEIKYADLKLVLSTRELFNVNNNKSVRLNYKEAEIITILLKSPKIIISKEEIITKVWGYDSDAGDNNVEAYISFIRKKMAFLESKIGINSIKKVGYLLGEDK